MFIKLDLLHAYQQMELDCNARLYVIENTHQGLNRYRRLSFGIISTPAMFWRTMDTIPQGIFRYLWLHFYIDVILVTGPYDHTHIQHLYEVLNHLQHYGVCRKHSKSHFFEKSVEFLGPHIDAKKLNTTTSKIEAIQLAPGPTNNTLSWGLYYTSMES